MPVRPFSGLVALVFLLSLMPVFAATDCMCPDRCVNLTSMTHWTAPGQYRYATMPCQCDFSGEFMTPHDVIHCQYGCDYDTDKCRLTPLPVTDRCKGITCADRCVNGVMYSHGECDPADGKCAYSSHEECEGVCDQAGKACAQAAGAGGTIAGEVYITDFSYQNPQMVKRPLKNAMMEIRFKDESGSSLNSGMDNPTIWLDENGRFSWSSPTVFAQGNTMDIAIYFKDKDGKVQLLGTAGTADSAPSYGYVVMGLPVTTPGLSDYQIDLTDLGITATPSLDAYGKAYINVLRAVEFKEKALGLTPTTKEQVWMYSLTGTSHTGEQYPDSGMYINTGDSGFFALDSPDNREFHEYCHHIEDEAKPVQYGYYGKDHGSYNGNRDTEWGMTEAWAEFCSLQIKKYYGLGSNGLYYFSGGMHNFELNHKVDANPDGRFSEEIALGGIMLDLADSASDYGGKDDDSVSLPLSTVWGAFSQSRDFGDGPQYPRSLYDFYVAVKALAPGSAAGIDNIFIAHNAFQDLNSNGRWDSGEPAGYSGKGSTYRKDLEPQPGTEVLFNVKDQNGNTVKTLVAHVDVKLDAPNDYLSYSYNMPVVDGKTYVPVPPEGYDGRITMTAVQAGTAETASGTFSITASDARAKLASGTPFGTYEADITTTPVACSTDYQCRALGVGTACTGGTCSGTAGGGESCCGSAFLIAFIAAGTLAFSRRKQ